MDATFVTIKSLVSDNMLLICPKYRKDFIVHKKLKDYQLDSVVSQEGCLITFFSRNLNTAQKRYTTTEKELLGIA